MWEEAGRERVAGALTHSQINTHTNIPPPNLLIHMRCPLTSSNLILTQRRKVSPTSRMKTTSGSHSSSESSPERSEERGGARRVEGGWRRGGMRGEEGWREEWGAVRSEGLNPPPFPPPAQDSPLTLIARILLLILLGPSQPAGNALCHVCLALHLGHPRAVGQEGRRGEAGGERVGER